MSCEHAPAAVASPNAIVTDEINLPKGVKGTLPLGCPLLWGKMGSPSQLTKKTVKQKNDFRISPEREKRTIPPASH
jgi:hypothetical protein